MTTTRLPAELQHIHGLAADVKTTTIYAGTHDGLYTINADGTASSVGSSRDDLMGLTASATGDLFASGHPGPNSTVPNPLGLIRSQDGGLTWVPVSRTGETDFHSLAMRGTTVVGYDGEALRISADAGRSWTAGAAQPVWSISVDRSSIWTTGPAGLRRSVDNGMSFAPVPNAPQLILATSASNGEPWGITSDGNVVRRNDTGTWRTVATLPIGQRVSALVASGVNTLLITTDESIIKVIEEPSVATASRVEESRPPSGDHGI